MPIKILTYSATDETEKLIAVFYANKTNNLLAKDFFSGERSIASSSEAIEIAKCFGEMTELAADDHLNNRNLLDGVDLEFWMYKLFNNTYGYYIKNGFQEEWKSMGRENL